MILYHICTSGEPFLLLWRSVCVNPIKSCPCGLCLSPCWTKASKLVPFSLLPHWNSMRIFRDGITPRLELNGGSKIRDPAKFRHVTNILKLVRYYVVITSRTCRHCEISKKLTLNPTITPKNTPLFLFPYMACSLQIFA